MTEPPIRLGAFVVHSFRCTREAAIVETVRADPFGKRWTVAQCVRCEGSDLTHRMRLATRGRDVVTDPEPPHAA